MMFRAAVDFSKLEIMRVFRGIRESYLQTELQGVRNRCGNRPRSIDICSNEPSPRNYCILEVLDPDIYTMATAFNEA